MRASFCSLGRLETKLHVGDHPHSNDVGDARQQEVPEVAVIDELAPPACSHRVARTKVR